MDYPLVGGRIREARIKAGFDNGAEFARATKMKPDQLYRLEGGRLSVVNDLSRLAAICASCNVTADWLLYGYSGGDAAQQVQDRALRAEIEVQNLRKEIARVTAGRTRMMRERDSARTDLKFLRQFAVDLLGVIDSAVFYGEPDDVKRLDAATEALRTAAQSVGAPQGGTPDVVQPGGASCD